MTIGAFRSGIQQQLVQLMAQSPSYSGFPRGAHRAYLVSNGQFDEEVHAATREMNNGPYPSKVELWSRGQLFAQCLRHGARLWPSEIKGNRALLEIYMSDPRGPLPAQVLSDLLSSVLALSADDEAILGDAAFLRASSSAAWLTGIAVAQFAEVENHYAVAQAWTLCCVTLIAASERHAQGDSTGIEPSLGLARKALLDSLAALCEEIQGRKNLVEGNPLVDMEIWGWRRGVLRGLLTSLAIADGDLAVLSPTTRTFLHGWLRDPFQRGALWGEGAVANLFPWLVWLRSKEPTEWPDHEAVALATALVIFNQRQSPGPLATPYYGFEATARQAAGINSAGRNGLEEETFTGSSFTSELLLHFLARLNLKQHCKRLWPDFTKLSHRRLSFTSGWDYCALEAPRSIEETRLYPSTYEWNQLKADALDADAPSAVPESLRLNPWLLAMWWQVAPHRLNADAARVFAASVLDGWA